MPQYEYKVLKVPHNQQAYYCSFLASFGWQVQNIQESVDRVVSQTLGFSQNTNYGQMNATTYFHPHTNNAQTYGYSRNRGWGSQMNTEITDVQTSLTITFFRDLAIPYRYELQQVEKKFFEATPVYLKRCARGNKKNEDEWPERLAVLACSREGKALLARGKEQNLAQKQPAQVSSDAGTATTQKQQAAVIPAEPPSVVLRGVEVIHNVFQSNQPGIQISLNFSIKNRKDIECRAVTYFYDENQNPLQDINQRFKTASNKVSVGSTFKPGFDETFYNNYILFMPYSELDQQDGDYTFNFIIKIYDEVTKTFLASSPYIKFHYSQKKDRMRGEAIGEAKLTEAAFQDKPAVNGTKETKQSKPKKTEQPAQAKPSAPQRPSFAEYSATFCRNYGWDVLTEDRKVYLQGLELSYAGKYRETRKFYKKALSLNPKESLYWTSAAQRYFEDGQFDEAITFLQKGLKELPDDSNLLYLISRAYIRKSDWEAARQIAQKIAEDQDRLAQINYYSLVGEYHEARKEYQQAIPFYDRADELRDPENNPLKGFFQQRCRSLMKG